VEGTAAFGCPMFISLGDDYHLSLRRSEVETIEVKKIEVPKL